MARFYLDLDQGQGVNIDDSRIIVRVCKRTGRKVRLSIQADRQIKIRRDEETTEMKTHAPSIRDRPPE